MKKLIVLVHLAFVATNAFSTPLDTVKFGNAIYVNLEIGESINYHGKTIELLELTNNRSLIKVENETLWLDVAKRSLPKISGGVRFFVSDQINVKRITTNSEINNLLTKQVLLCISDPEIPLLDPQHFTFPISDRDGFTWTMEEDSHMFAYLGPNKWKSSDYYRSHEGIDLNLHDARGKFLHPLVAIESATIVLVADSTVTKTRDGCIILKSDSQENIYYVYKHTNPATHKVKAGQKVKKGEFLSYIWGDNRWGHLHFSIVYREDTPAYTDRYKNVLNFFPQLYELYHGGLQSFSRTYDAGHFEFDQPRWLCKNYKRLDAFDEKTGYGWKLGEWCVSQKVEGLKSNDGGNARLWKTIHAATPAESENPESFYDFEIAVQNGLYNVRAILGDLILESSQKVFIENTEVGVVETDKGSYKETPALEVEVKDGKLTIRLEIISEDKCASLKEVLFERVTL